MNDTADGNLRPHVERLDAAVSRDDAVILFQQYGGGLDEEAVLGTRTGYLRLGIEFLKIGTTAGKSEGPLEVAADLNYLVHPNSNIFPHTFVRDEAIEQFNRPNRDDNHPTRILPPHWLIFGCIAAYFLAGLYGAFALLLRFW